MTYVKHILEGTSDTDYDSVWKQFADEIHGKYIHGNQDKVQFRYKNHIINFDTYTYAIVVDSAYREIEYARAMVEFHPADDLNLTITPQGFIENIGRMFGGQDIIVDDDHFDSKFMIRGNNERKIHKLFSNNEIKKLLLKQDTARLEITNESGLFDEKVREGYSMIYYLAEEKVTDISQLHQLLGLFTELIDELIKLGSIKPR